MIFCIVYICHSIPSHFMCCVYSSLLAICCNAVYIQIARREMIQWTFSTYRSWILIGIGNGKSGSRVPESGEILMFVAKKMPNNAAESQF